ncbi:MAG: hypothetical protein JWQ70_2294 [Aeromicrobium sp.]|nr:hypothetical protein [Aeromicrobium sp.]
MDVKRTARRSVAFWSLVAVVAAMVLGSGTSPSDADDSPRTTPLITMTDPVNLARLGERTVSQANLGFQAAVSAAALRATTDRLHVLTTDPERRPDPNPCTLAALCIGDPRLDHFAAKTGGIVKPVLFTARSGATLSGHVWAARSGASRRPLVVIVNGSLIDFEQGHWPQAQALAQAGYVVLTFDVQGEGLSDQLGVGRDALDTIGAGIPGLSTNGRPFYDGAVDALDFALSRPDHRYIPRVGRTSGKSHDDKQRRRVAEGRDTAWNPLWRMVDPQRVGIAGYSYGAVAASYVAQADPRIDAVVAWDSLCVPVQPSPDEIKGLFFSSQTTILPGVTMPLAAQIPRDCFGAPPGRTPRMHAPALGISGDFVLPGLVQSTDPAAKVAASRRYSKAHVDTGQIVIQGATHADFTVDSSVPLLPARLRGMDLTTWYTIAWFDKYLRNDPTADRRLLSRRWQNDSATGAVDPVKDANLFSQLFTSRLDVTLRSGRRWTCEDLRHGCSGMFARDEAPAFDYVSYTTRPPT